MKRKLVICLAALGLLLSLAGCVRSTMFVMVRQAEATLADAEKAGAANSATYEFEAGKAWLALAKHEVNEMDGTGETYAKKALDMADAALKKATGGAK